MRSVLILTCALLLCAGAFAKDAIIYDQDAPKPTELHYVLGMAFNDGRLSEKSLKLVNGGLNSDPNLDADSEISCEKLGLDKVISEYSENVPGSLCRYSDNMILENEQEYSVCTVKRSYTRDNSYYCEVQNASGGFLESFDFTFTVQTKCFDCVTDESVSGEKCLAENKFDFTLTMPFHQDASRIAFFEKQRDGSKKQVSSIGLEKFKDAVKNRAYDDAAL